MGDVIRAGAAGADIFKDTRTSLANGVAKGGAIKERAEQVIGPVVAMIDAIEAELKEASDALTPLLASVRAQNEESDATLNRIYDDTWNDVGRPANDRYLTLMYPAGAGYYTEGDTAAQPVRMELLAKLYDRKIHPKLTDAQSVAYAARVRESAAELEADLEAAKAPSANVTLLERVRTALARVAQFELANLKRAYKMDGMTEAAIHSIIPDRPPPKKPVKRPEAGAPGAAKPSGEAKKPEAGAADAAKPSGEAKKPEGSAADAAKPSGEPT